MENSTLHPMIAAMPFAAGLGIEILSAEPEEVRGRMNWAPERCTTGGMLHGGALMAFADSLGAVCAFLNLPAGAATTTIESKTNFFRGVSSGELVAISKPLHAGRRFIVVQTDIHDTQGKRIAQVTQSQAVLS
ncbi:MAG TPA: PaaI family thioesterase [Terriglobales bacterium]|nr:PaaI family thioesterase [Terriglobales bacterium]